MHQFLTLDDTACSSAVQPTEVITLTPALLQLILQTLQALRDRKITREMVVDGQQESSAFTFIRYTDTTAIPVIV